MLDAGICRSIDQITVEWHHHSFDSRYLGGSSPPINAVSTLLHACGLNMFAIKDDVRTRIRTDPLARPRPRPRSRACHGQVAGERGHCAG